MNDKIVIKPTVGRIVWFYEHNQQQEPKAAIVAKVWDEKIVNLAVVEEDGTTKAMTSVRLLQEDEPTPSGMRYATWMPYQIGQARKHSEAGA